MLKFTIGITPTTKKNSQRIFRKKLKSGKVVPFIVPSEKFKEYQNHCSFYIPDIKETISRPVNIKAIYYRSTRRKVDISNLHSALHDILIHYQVIQDDDCTIVVGTDGSRVAYDKTNPRTDVTITESDYKCWDKKKKKTIDDILPEKPKKRLRKVYV